MSAIASPYRIQILPRQAQFYKKAFRSGTVDSSRLGRLVNRAMFYGLETLRSKPCYGRFSYQAGDSVTSIRFDARNRQYSALYFDAFLPIYEPDVTAAILEFVPADGVFYDVGSNWGYFSLFLAAKAGFRGRIHAFEPWPATHGDLVGNIAQARLEGTIVPHKLALGDRNGSVSMQCGRHSGLARIADAPTGEQVEQATLDGIAVEEPDFMKLDVEGVEAAVLKGGRGVLDSSRPIIVFEHTPGVDDRQVPSILAEHRYELYQPLPTLDATAPAFLKLRHLAGGDLSTFSQRCNLLAFPRERRESLDRYLNIR